VHGLFVRLAEDAPDGAPQLEIQRLGLARHEGSDLRLSRRWPSSVHIL
jgi:hypothetical protein